jgi:alkylated DNA repair dioxygenase AlkB
MKGKGVIASLSLGATRKFVIKHRQNEEKYEFNLTSGNLVVMDGITQKYYKHAVPKQAKVTEPRINLTFRIS